MSELGRRQPLLMHGGVVPQAAVVVAAGTVGFLGYGVSLSLFVLGLRHLGAARTGAYFSLAHFVGAALAVSILGEPFSARLLAAGALMGAGLWLHLMERHGHLHGEMEHEHRHNHDAHHGHDHAPATDPRKPHTHAHRHVRLVHRHPHFPDLHHRHGHSRGGSCPNWRQAG